MNRFVPVILAAAAIGSASSAAISAELIETRCHMDYCGWVSIEERDIITSNASGALFKVRTKGWSAHYPGGDYSKRVPRKYGGENVSYAFCSKTEPATMFSYEGKITVSPLPLGTPDVSVGASISAVIFYFAVCHGLNVKQQDVAEVGEQGARRLGYRVVDPDKAQYPIARIEDFLRR